MSKINEQAQRLAVEYWEKVEATGMAYEFTPKTLVIAAFRDGLLAELKSHRNEVRQLRRENAALRKDLERFTGGGMLDCHMICDQRDRLERENAELRNLLIESADALESDIEFEREIMWRRICDLIDKLERK